MGFDMSKILNYVFIGVGLILAVIISPLVSNAGENMYSSVRDHCNLNGSRFIDVLNFSSAEPPLLIRVPLTGGNAVNGVKPCIASATVTTLYNSGENQSGNNGTTPGQTAASGGSKTFYAQVRNPQSDSNNLRLSKEGDSAAQNWNGASLVANAAGGNGEWQDRPTIGRSLSGAHDIVVAILTPAVAISIIGGMGVSVWMNMSGQSSQSMMARFASQLAAVIGVVVVGVISPLIINFTGDWATSVQQLTSAQLLAPVYGVLFDLVPLMLAFVMVAMASLPAWGGIAGRGMSALQQRYAM